MGEVFAGRYELVDPIARGGAGAVWRAWDHRRRRYVAAKVLLHSDAHSLLRFVREQALRIDHPHVLAPASWAADDDKVLFTMDLVAGGSLVHLVNDYGPLPPAYVCTLLDQLLSGLSAVHGEGVVHRDIKPANILLEATGRARPRLRLSDFGIAMRLGEPRLTQTDYMVGTPGYVAPETLLGADPDHRADLFAVGLVALYLLEGSKPDAKALVEHFAEHGTPHAPKGVPEPLWEVVATLLQPDPQARFRTATGARKALATATELLPEPPEAGTAVGERTGGDPTDEDPAGGGPAGGGLADEPVEIFDQLGPLPEDFGPDGPLRPTRGVRPSPPTDREPSAAVGEGFAPLSTPPSASALASPFPAYIPPDATPPRPAHPPVPLRPPAPPPASVATLGLRLPPPPSTPPVVPTGPAIQPIQPASGISDVSDASDIPGAPESSPPAPPQTPTGTAQPDRTYPAPGTSASSPRRSHRARRRPGPPAKVTIPVLLLALACYAVGFWALTQI
jgi:eukaryotic-like serine/threonine-protein kinase